MGKTIFALVFTLAASAAMAQSNIGLTDYPGPKCAKPEKPVPPGAAPALDEGPAGVDAYNASVRRFNNAVAGYNQAVADFNSCMKSYVDNGNADMARIKQKLDQAVLQAGMP